MRNLVKSMFRLGWAMPGLALNELQELVRSGGKTGPVARDLDSITRTIEDQLEGSMKGIYEGGDRLQQKVADAVLGSPGDPDESEEEEERELSPRPDAGELDLGSFVVIGGSLAAGFGDFTLVEEMQRESFVAQLASQLGCELSQPLIESPGIGDALGFAQIPLQVPALMQTTALRDFPPSDPPRNLSVPGFRLVDALERRPRVPIVAQDDTLQTCANLILGPRDLVEGRKRKLATQLELALAHRPTFTVVELGFQEVLEAAVLGDLASVPDSEQFAKHLEEIVRALVGKGSQVLLLTVPDPFDTAYFSTLDSAAANLKVDPSVLVANYGFAEDSRISVPGLLEVGYQMLASQVGVVSKGGVASGELVGKIANSVVALNSVIQEIASRHGAEVFDLAGCLGEVGRKGINVGSRKLTADFLGGFYLLNGYCPGATGHAVIANGILEKLNERYGADFPLVSLGRVLARDPAADHRPAQGPVLTSKDFPTTESQGVTEVAEVAVAKSTSKPRQSAGPKKEGPLELPPGREQTLPLCKESSYFGDAIRAVNCRDQDEAVFGSGRELYFGGLAMTDSHLSGELRFRFAEPVDGSSHFEVLHGRLEGDDGDLAAPQFFKLPVRHNEVQDDSELVSQGDLDLETGEVSNLAWAVRFGNTALLALVRVNPKLPDIPIEFPGLYGSAWARFDAREDGLLDFTFYGSTFLPLGAEIEGLPVRFPLPFCSPTLEYASIPAAGTTLHPHLHLSTREPEEVDPALVPEIPANTVREYTLLTRNTAFGDKFALRAPELAGDPTGRSQLQGRLQVQFGPPSGDSVPVAISCLNPGGMLARATPNPLDDDFPGRLPPSPVGHNEFLRFATRNYYLDALTCIDDPFDLSVGNVSRKSGRLLGDLLHRALIGQNLFYALLRVEPRTPKASFNFRGRAGFEKGRDKRTVFRFHGQVVVPYPEGYLFPNPDMATGVAVGPDSVLDPFYWIQAMEHDRSSTASSSGKASRLLASTGELFSYNYDIAGNGKKKAKFEYTNHTVGGVFKLRSLSWVSFVNSRDAEAEGFDTVTFSGFGHWSRDDSEQLHLACVQICESREVPYVSIQIGGGAISNVNTKPERLEDVRP